MFVTAAVLSCTLVHADTLNLKQVCSSGKQSSSLKLNKISQVRALIDESRAKGAASECSAHAPALEQLDEILARVQTGNTCNLTLVDKIRDFQTAHLAADANKSKDAQLPQQLRQFFLALCFQISAGCKMTLINSLEFDTSERIKEQDYKSIEMLERYGATLLDKDAELEDFDDILLLEDMQALSGQQPSQQESSEDDAGSKLIIKTKTNDVLRDLIRTCKQKFKPIYDKLIMPLIKLSNLGYNYRGELLARELEELKTNKLVKRWYNIVQTCEAFNNIEIYEDKDLHLGDDRQAFTFISGAEAEELRKRNASVTDTDGDGEDDFKPEEYEPMPSSNNDDLWIQNQAELEKLVTKYKAGQSEAERIRAKMFKKLMTKVKEALKSGKILTFVSDTVKSVKSNAAATGSSSVTSVNEDLVMMVDDVVDNSDPNKAHKIDGAVAGAYPSARYPSRSRPVVRAQNKTKLLTRLHDMTIGAVLPSKLTLFFYLIAFVGGLMLVTAMVAGG